MGKFIDLTGQRYGRLIVVERGEQKPDKTVSWVCKCDCGNTIVARRHDLRSGNTRSCGCLRKETFQDEKNRGHSKPRYGPVEDVARLRTVWAGIKQRCNNPKHSGYEYYGARGIKICDEWADFGAFLNWATESGYDRFAKQGECTIDRIDVNGDYEPNNCRWVTMAEQNKNRRPRSCWRKSV